jgi:uncharacterized protein (DUF2132 family)
MTTEQPNNPLHGVTLQALVEELVARYGWEGLAARVPINCFKYYPTLSSSLKFLRKDDRSRAQVERLYIADRRTSSAAPESPPDRIE